VTTVDHVVYDGEDGAAKEDDRSPVHSIRSDGRCWWKSKEHDQEQIVEQRNNIGIDAQWTHVPSSNLPAVAAGRACPERASVRQGVGSVESDELAGDDGVKGYKRAEVDAHQCDGDEAGDEDGISRWVRWLRDLCEPFGAWETAVTGESGHFTRGGCVATGAAGKGDKGDDGHDCLGPTLSGFQQWVDESESSWVVDSGGNIRNAPHCDTHHYERDARVSHITPHDGEWDGATSVGDFFGHVGGSVEGCFTVC
jgi:hypothetical protein